MLEAALAAKKDGKPEPGEEDLDGLDMPDEGEEEEEQVIDHELPVS